MQSAPFETHAVLVVDDSDVQRHHAMELCKMIGVGQVLEACDGQDALLLLDTLAEPPSLMIIDLEMPEMDGVELIEALRIRNHGIPIVLASSRETALIDSIAGMNPDVIGGLSKPLTHKALHDLLQESAFKGRRMVKTERRPAVSLPITAEMLGQAIQTGAILPHFQPKVDTKTGLLRGVEALARWHHPELGMVPPDQFVLLAENEGLIMALTLCMMNQSFAQCAAWSDRGMRISVAVNLSPQLLGAPNIVSEICALQQRHGIHPSQVILEVTESTVVDQSGPALASLARLRLKGFGLSIDDYGTGFSSMQQLSRIPFTELKIDRSFVHGAHRRKGLRVILESALDMARGLELSTVAEGVETMEDWRLLQQFGCTAAQGWLIAKAMPGDELLSWTKAHQERLPLLRAPCTP